MTDPALAKKTSHGRFYRHPGDGRMVPSITNIKGMKAIPALPAWAAREAANYAADNINSLSKLPHDDIVQLVKGAPYRRDSSKNASALAGNIVHDWIDQDIRGEQVDPGFYLDREGERQVPPQTAKWMWNSYRTFVGYYKPTFVKSEFTVWSHEHGYAGTGDWCGYITSPTTGELSTELTLGDTKTGKASYPDMAMQLAAIAHADCIITPDGVEQPLPEFKRFAILHVRPRFVELIPVEHVEEWWKAFLGLKAVFDTVTTYEEETLLYTPKLQVRVAA